MKNIIDCLRERGLIEDVTSGELENHLSSPRRLYLGIDPTADSLHLGHLLGIVVLKWFQKYGHQPVAIIGGATGRIGDPAGKSHERPLLEDTTIVENVRKLSEKIRHILTTENSEQAPLFLDNFEWLGSYRMLDFLRDIGKHFRLGNMLAKDSVKSRLNSEEGISFTEFSYQLLQSYDFYYLFQERKVTLQIGGSDQWGNITAGIELVRKLSQESVFGLTFPLLTRSDGKKFGKSEQGAIWLSAERLSPYDFYQHLYRMPDADVIKLLKMLTFLPLEKIQALEEQMSGPDYIPNTAQKVLAKEVTEFVHGASGLEQALSMTERLSPGSEVELSRETLDQIAAEGGGPEIPASELIGEKFVEVARKVGLVSSKGEGQRLIQNGGAYLNNKRLSDVNATIAVADLVDGEYLLVGAGKKKKVLITVVK